MQFGMFVSSMLTINLARKRIIGIQGWRIAFALVGSLSFAVAALIVVFMKEHRRPSEEKVKTGIFGAVFSELLSLLSFFTIPTFGIMIMQGIFGTIPWTVMGYMTTFFQLGGMDDGAAAVLAGEMSVTGMFGS